MRRGSCFQDQNVGTGTAWSALWARGHTEGAGTKLAVTGRVTLELHHSGEIGNFFLLRPLSDYLACGEMLFLTSTWKILFIIAALLNLCVKG